MTEITPEQAAADATEALWRARVNGEDSKGKCGWCEFAAALSKKHLCTYCPIKRVSSQGCYFNQAFRSWQTAKTSGFKIQAAAWVYALLIKNRQRLLAAAREILNEAKQ